MRRPVSPRRIPAWIAAALSLIAAAAAPAAAAGGRDGEKADPGRQICKSKPAIGSRLKRIRECATAEQWEEMKLQERVGLMRKQVNGAPGCPGCGVANDTPW
jgi:hypothetical protein